MMRKLKEIYYHWKIEGGTSGALWSDILPIKSFSISKWFGNDFFYYWLVFECQRKNEKKLCRVHLGEGIAVCEEQLRAVKWSDYRKLTRGLAAILFSPTELATCSVTGQRWSRAGTATERPVKPALDRAKVQAII
ncbi:hypothetical protein PV325_007273, partial [Microctonus aethiopoides]